ncbi:MAG: hypothetical protein JKX68_09715 [Flavobacteriales bacterium]|nr:hypothetical protein [Flavobacteriales bacterium]
MIKETKIYQVLARIKRNVRLIIYPKPKAQYTYREFCKMLTKTKGTFFKYDEIDYHKTQRFPFELSDSFVRNKKVCFLRHDIDHDPFIALKMAKIEAEYKLFGSYYMLTTDTDIKKIWDKKRVKSLKALKEIQDLGHEVGFHYDLLGDYLETGKDVGRICEQTLAEFRAAGIKVSGCVAHGSGRLSTYLSEKKIKDYPRECLNFNIWEESNEKPGMVELNNRKVNIPFLKLTDYGMRYEAYKVRRNYYHSDNGYVFWQHGDPIETINDKMDEGEVTCILVHPYVWRKNMG